MKSSLISNRPFQLVLQLTTSTDMRGSASLQNTAAVQALLCNLEVNFHICGRFSRIWNGFNYCGWIFVALSLYPCQVWQKTADNLELSVLNHFGEILKSSR